MNTGTTLGVTSLVLAICSSSICASTTFFGFRARKDDPYAFEIYMMSQVTMYLSWIMCIMGVIAIIFSFQ